MNSKIKNVDEILSVGDTDSRNKIITLTNSVLEKLDGYNRVKSFMRLDGDTLYIGNCKWDLSNRKHIYIFGAGKACNHMARAATEILGDKLSKAIIIVKFAEETDTYVNTEVFVGGHPLPNHEGEKACRRMLEIVDQSSEGDLFIILISGGSTSLMGCPVDGVSLEDLKESRDVMLKSNMRILDINCVNGHCEQLNRGRLGKRISDHGGEIVCLNIWDVIGWPEIEDYGEPVDMFGTPIGPDFSTFDDARRIIIENDLADRLPKAVFDYIQNGTTEQETPKKIDNATYFFLNILLDSCKYAVASAEEMGIDCHVLTTSIEGESKDAGMVLASIAREIQQYNRPFKAPCFLFACGETTTNIADSKTIRGHGGPSHEMAAGFAINAVDIPGACILSIDTEGSDGTTVYAGAITDSSSLKRAEIAGFILQDSLRTHASFEALSSIKDCVYTGNTGTNLCDFDVVYVPAVKR